MPRLLFSSPNFSVFLTTLLLVHPSFSDLTRDPTSAPPKPRIVGGTDCSVDKHPSIVWIQFQSDGKEINDGGATEEKKSGTLIHPKWVLASALPLLRKFLPSTPVLIEAGWDAGFGFDGKSQLRYVHNVYFNASDGVSTVTHHIALVELKKAFYMTDRIVVAKLPQPPSSDDQFCSKALTMGWERSSKVVTPSASGHGYHVSTSSLQCLELPMVPASVCESPLDIVDKILCAKFDGEGKGACPGDEGGPIFCKDQPTTVIGILKSASKDRSGGCGKGFPMTFTRVDAYLDWIHKHVSKDEGNKQRKKDDKGEDKEEDKELKVGCKNGSGDVHVEYIWLVVLLLINVLFFYLYSFISSQGCDSTT